MIRLSEAELCYVLRESVKRVLREASAPLTETGHENGIGDCTVAKYGQVPMLAIRHCLPNRTETDRNHAEANSSRILSVSP